MIDEKIQLSIEDYKFIQIIMTQAARMGCFRGLDEEEAIRLYNKIHKIIENIHKENEKKSID